MASQSFRLSGWAGPGECHLTPNILVRAKVGQGRALPYGQCGANPPVWLSLWVDGRKWLSRFSVGGHCVETVLKEIRVTPEGMQVCTKPEYPADGQEDVEDCEDHKAANLAQTTDVKEFPSDPDTPPQGSIVVAHAEDPEFCGRMIVPGSDAYGVADWRIDFPKPLDRDLQLWPTDGSSYTRNRFDIDNDGREEVVYGYHPMSRMNDFDVYFASPGQAVDDAWPKSERQVNKLTSPYAFPFRFRTCDGRTCGPDEAGEIALQHVQKDDAAPSWDTRYVHAQPFVFNGVTYFYLSAMGDDELSAIVKPHPTALDEVCIFRAIPQNF
jgi:hypothetical protein